MTGTVSEELKDGEVDLYWEKYLWMQLLMKKDGSRAAIYRWRYETAVSKGWQFLMPLVFLKILFCRELKLVSLILYLLLRQCWLHAKASVDGNDPSFTLTKFVCKCRLKEGGIPHPVSLLSKPTYFPSGWFEGRRDHHTHVRVDFKERSVPSH